MKIIKTIISCFYDCPFFGKSSDGMQCDHPYFKDKGAYDNIIITNENSKDGVPEQCPLKKEDLVFTYKTAI